MRNTIFNCCRGLLLLAALWLFPQTASASATRGDVNLDNTCNISDVTCLISHVLTGNTENWRDDINGDGTVTIADVTALISSVLTGVYDWPEWTGPAVPDNAEVFTVNGVSFAMIPVEGGDFTPGGHTVTLHDYSIGQTEVTQELWEAVMGDNPSFSWGYSCSCLPVNTITWWNCQYFISKLNELTGRTFHLPTSDEWLYAAMGGQLTHNYTYAGSNDVNEVAWYSDNDPDPSNLPTMPVGLKAPNELGLYDMCGNVEEWCYDRRAGLGQELLPLDDQEHIISTKAVRGGSVICSAGEIGGVMIISCHNKSAGVAYRYIGMRLALW